MSNFNNFSNQPHRYSLEKGSKKNHCPDCNKKTFVLYIDTETGDYLPEQYGRCDKGDGHYFLNPYKDGYAKIIWEQEQKVTGVTKVTVPKQKYISTQSKPQPTPEPVYFDFNTFKQTLEPERYEKTRLYRTYFTGYNFPLKLMRLQRLFSCTDWGRLQMVTEQGQILFLLLI